MNRNHFNILYIKFHFIHFVHLFFDYWNGSIIELIIEVIEMISFLFHFTGFESNARSSSTRFAQRSQGIAQLGDHGSKDEGDLSHDESVQRWRNKKVPYRRMLGTCIGSYYR